MSFIRLFDYFFHRWTTKVVKTGQENWIRTCRGMELAGSEYIKNFVLYEDTNKFDGSVKLRKVYLDS